MIHIVSGLIDPMTGEGIHTAMESGKIAASVLEDAFAVGNFDSAVLKEYQNRWLNSFGTDFYWYVHQARRQHYVFHLFQQVYDDVQIAVSVSYSFRCCHSSYYS